MLKEALGFVFVITFSRDQSNPESKTFPAGFPELTSRRRSNALMHSSALCFTWRKLQSRKLLYMLCKIFSWLHTNTLEFDPSLTKNGLHNVQDILLWCQKRKRNSSEVLIWRHTFMQVFTTEVRAFSFASLDIMVSGKSVCFFFLTLAIMWWVSHLLVS